MPLPINTTICSQPAILTANVSLCAESLYSNVPAFYDFEDLVPEPFDLLTACNGGDEYQEVLLELPGVCPECQETASCTFEEVAMHATGLCASSCDEVGLSLYPDVSRTEPVEYGNFGCDPTYYEIPSVPEAPVCEAKGASSIGTIEVNSIGLKDVSGVESTEGNDESSMTIETNVEVTEGYDESTGSTETEATRDGTSTEARESGSRQMVIIESSMLVIGVAVMILFV
jgi:hypothetical protein